MGLLGSAGVSLPLREDGAPMLRLRQNRFEKSGDNLATNLNEVQKILEAEGIDFATSIQDLSAFSTILIELPSSRVSETAGRGVISRRQLRSLREKLSELLRCTVEFLVNGDSISLSYAAALADLLARRFGSADYTVTIKLSPLERCFIWIDTRKASIEIKEVDIRSLVDGFLSGIGMVAEQVYLMLPGLRNPSDLEILRAIKIVAPVAMRDLRKELTSGGLLSADDRWLNVRLDTLRKKNLVHRTAGGLYLLTEVALSLVPVSRTRNSSDVSRALHLARRKW